MKSRYGLLTITLVITVSILSYLEWGTGTPSQLQCVFNKCSVDLGMREVHPIIDQTVSRHSTDIPYIESKSEPTSDTIPLNQPSSKILSWCADKFDSVKHEFQQNFDGSCDNPICPESEPPIFSSALNSDEEFIEKGCAKFVDKWAYLTEDNDYTWHSVYWKSFVKHHYESDPILDPQRNQKCAELFDLIMRSSEDSDLWYELTETNDFRDAKCASIVSEWEHLTEHDVWNIGISWDNVVEHELYGCGENEIYDHGICMTQEIKERAEFIGEKENEN